MPHSRAQHTQLQPHFLLHAVLDPPVQRQHPDVLAAAASTSAAAFAVVSVGGGQLFKLDRGAQEQDGDGVDLGHFVGHEIGLALSHVCKCHPLTPHTSTTVHCTTAALPRPQHHTRPSQPVLRRRRAAAPCVDGLVGDLALAPRQSPKVGLPRAANAQVGVQRQRHARHHQPFVRSRRPCRVAGAVPRCCCFVVLAAATLEKGRVGQRAQGPQRQRVDLALDLLAQVQHGGGRVGAQRVLLAPAPPVAAALCAKGFDGPQVGKLVRRNPFGETPLGGAARRPVVPSATLATFRGGGHDENLFRRHGAGEFHRFPLHP
mmetsp:Transcript_76159/g.149149  ORF Transcript_76159/g.149149 Transcript_76159/m.149149 type:complete len:317 (-) Transcript_76159:172-1122(-)